MNPPIQSPARVTSADLLNLLQKLHSDYPIAVANKLNFPNMWCDADFIAVNRGGSVIEYEIKISRSDFLRDRQKTRFEIYSLKRDGRLPNRFWYVTAPGIVTLEDIPSWAGWMELEGNELRVRRNAPRMTIKKFSLEDVLRLAKAMRRRAA